MNRAESAPSASFRAAVFAATIFVAIFFVIRPCARAAESVRETRYEFERVRMAVPIRIVLYADCLETARRCAELGFDQFAQLDAIMSDYDRDSEIMSLARRNDEVNREENVGEIWHPVGGELYAVLEASRFYGEVSGGAFEVSVSPLVQLWRRAKRLRTFPPEERLARANTLVGPELWDIRSVAPCCGNSGEGARREIMLRKPGMRFDFGGIAKGYAIDKAFEIIRRQGMCAILVDAGGDMRLGTHPGEGWIIGFAPGKRCENTETVGSETTEDAMPPATLRLKNVSIATSGDTHQFWEHEGKRHSHIIDPRSGMPLEDSPIVTVIAETAMQADALASSVSVLGPDEGLALLNHWEEKTGQKPAPQAMIVTRDDPPCFRYTNNWDVPREERNPQRIDVR